MLKIILDCLFYVCCCGGRYLKHLDSSDIAKEYDELLEYYRQV